ncbi:MAG: SHOCT-like domain-containing protein [Thermomicrobiales bacterium]
MSDTTPIRGSRRDNTGDERLEILRLVEEGAINADEASRLLDALSASDRGPGGPTGTTPPDASGRTGGRHVRIRVSDSQSGKSRVNLVLPLGLLDAGLGVARRFAPDRFSDVGFIRESLLSGAVGPLLDIDENGERVQIIVE